MLSGLKVPTWLRTDIGRYMRRWGYWEENQFPAAERQLARFPQAQWKVTTVTAGELTAEVHHRDLLVLMASVLRHPRCDPRTDLVWGPEVQTDEDTGDCPTGTSC